MSNYYSWEEIKERAPRLVFYFLGLAGIAALSLQLLALIPGFGAVMNLISYLVMIPASLAALAFVGMGVVVVFQDFIAPYWRSWTNGEWEEEFVVFDGDLTHTGLIGTMQLLIGLMIGLMGSLVGILVSVIPFGALAAMLWVVTGGAVLVGSLMVLNTIIPAFLLFGKLGSLGREAAKIGRSIRHSINENVSDAGKVVRSVRHNATDGTNRT